ncbi:uncharacterized protein [Lepeophtheirus salmonis]|uniref:uncharacterized protein n=1 Tax=Lepeophtheirus salmonis TaxID=72036 RepID=UPI003AF331B3
MSNEMPSQIVFLLDLDGCVPLGEDGEGLLRRACSALLWAEASMSPGLKDKTDLPSFALRFYSSSGYFGIHDQSSYEFQDLAPESFEDLERVLSERLLALQSSFDASNFEFHGSQNRSDPVASLRTSLDLLARHYHWDRPLLHSPIKKNRHSFENSVYVFTSIPNTKREYRQTFHKSAKSHTQKELSDALFTKNVLQRFRQEISLYIVDFSLSNPSSFLEPPIKELFHKTLKPIRNGGLIPFTSLISYSHLSPYISSYKALRSKHPDKCISKDISLQGTLIPSFPLKNANRIKVESASILGMYPMDAFSGCQEWESHHSFRLAGSYEFFKAMSHWVLLIVLDTSKLAVLFNYGILSILSAKESSTYLSIFRVPEKPLTPCPNILKKIIDKHLKSNTLAKTIGSEKNLVKNNFSDGDLETWRIPNECADMSKRIKESKKSKGKWIEILVNSCKPKVSRMYQSEKRNNLLMERNDSGFSEGKRSSSSSSLSRRLSDESIGRRTRRGNQPIVSRGAELLRLGNQKYAENKKRRSQIKSSKNSTESFSFPFNDLRTARRTAFEKEMRKSLENEEVIQCSQILAMLIEFQIEAINNGDDVSMSALAEITISSLLKHLQSTGQIKANLVNLVADNFLVDPLSISRRKTSLKMPKRLRDHKLQVLYRMELHWLLPSADDQEKFENEILIHLRQISIWGSPEDMVTFLNEVLTPVYIDRQPELLCSLYDELNQPKADALRGIFSPSAKSDCSSVAPSSVMSQASNASQNSSKNPSLRSHNNKSVARIKKLRRPHSFDMGQRRQISQPHLKTTTARVLAKKPTYNIKDKVGPSVTASPSSKGRSGLHRVKRNLSFDGLGRSPMKKPSTPRKKHETPKKKVTGTPKRMTPNKTHRIYAPETPKNKTRRKSDGLITIEESPDIDSIKACKTTPRRMRASLNLYKKTSFYSGDVSRNLMKAEENVNAFKIQGTSSQSQPFLDESSCDNTAGYLFQHIIRKRNRPDDEDDNSRKKIRKIDDDHRFLSDPSSSPMKTPKKMTFKTPVKESPSPSKRVQFNMQHQPPTPSRGTPAKSILKTPSKEPQTPTNRLNSPLVHSSAARKSSPPSI